MSSFNWLRAELEQESEFKTRDLESVTAVKLNEFVDIKEYRQQYESYSKPMWTSSSKCESLDSLEVNTDWRDCDYNDRRKRVKNMHEIYVFIYLFVLYFAYLSIPIKFKKNNNK
jgi:hypothetical protein